MKQLLLALVASSFSLLNASAEPANPVVNASHQRPPLSRAVIPVKSQEMKKNTGEPAQLRTSNDNKPYYHRPAGAFFSPFVAVNGRGFYTYGDYSYLMVKPYSTYTYRAEELNNYYFYWRNNDFDFSIDENQEHIVGYDVLEQEPPKLFFSLQRDDIGDYYFQYPDHYSGHNQYGSYDDPINMSGSDDNPIIVDDGSHVMVVPCVNSAQIKDDSTEFLLSSKTMVGNDGVITRFSGAEPYGTNKYGWWFGKNGGHIDGIAQAFEKPVYPYLLNKVYLQSYTDMRVKDDVTMTCRVYRLDKIPSFVAGDCAKLPEEPGELIVTGEALVTPRTAEDNYGLIEFTLFSHDEDDPNVKYECTPTIDYPILVCIDGYNDPEMENLEEFSAFIAANWTHDEGYGELAYVKYPIYDYEYDEQGNLVLDEQGQPVTFFTGNYYWCGLNNFFEEPKDMKTGLTIFIAAERPYLVFNNPDETGTYKFDSNGGVMRQQIGDKTVDGIEFKAWTPSCDGDWTMSWNGKEELPDWLDIELIDGEENGHFNGIVTALVTASPQPKSYLDREAVIRFGFPGAYLDYKFIQGRAYTPCVLIDGEANIADINHLIDLIINDMYDNCYDVNEDNELNVADINALIDIILTL